MKGGKKPERNEIPMRTLDILSQNLGRINARALVSRKGVKEEARERGSLIDAFVRNTGKERKGERRQAA